MHVLIRGQRIKLKWVDPPLMQDGVELDGQCESPDGINRTIRICTGLTPERTLDVLLHEMLHAAYWDLDEEAIASAATDIARALTRLGYERKLL